MRIYLQRSLSIMNEQLIRIVSILTTKQRIPGSPQKNRNICMLLAVSESGLIVYKLLNSHFFNAKIYLMLKFKHKSLEKSNNLEKMYLAQGIIIPFSPNFSICLNKKIVQQDS